MKFVSCFLLTYGILYDNNGITKQLAKQIVNAQSIVIFSLKYLLTKQISRVWSLGMFVLYGAQCFLSNRLLDFFASAIIVCPVRQKTLGFCFVRAFSSFFCFFLLFWVRYYTCSASSKISFSVSCQPRHGSVMDLPYTPPSGDCAPSSM